MMTFFSDWFYLSIRNIKQIWRPLLALLPSLFIPVFFFTVNAQAFKSVAGLPGFPAATYLAFVAPTALFTAAFFPSGNVGIELVIDITSGYFKKLTIMPINRLSIILGKVSEAAFQAMMLALLMLIILYFLGIHVVTGLFGTLAIFALLLLFAMAWACFSLIAALQTQNPRLVQSLFMIAFPLLYVTTSQMPKQFLPPTYAAIASYNPATYVLEGVRALMIYGWNSPAIWQGFAVAGSLFVILLLLTLAAFQRTLK